MKAAKPYNATGHSAPALTLPHNSQVLAPDNAKYVRNAVCDRLLAGPVLQREREDVLHRLSVGDYVQWVLLLTRDMPFKVRSSLTPRPPPPRNVLQLRGIYGVQADGLLALAMGVGPAVITPAMSQEFLK